MNFGSSILYLPAAITVLLMLALEAAVFVLVIRASLKKGGLIYIYSPCLQVLCSPIAGLAS